MNFVANKRDKIFSGSLPHQSGKSKVSDIYIIISENSNILDLFSEITRLVMQGYLIFIPSFYHVHKQH
jgi:hypothetical protein